MIAQDELGTAQPQFGSRLRPQPLAERLQVLEKRPQVDKQPLARGRETKRAALEKLGADILLQLPHLPAYRGLLDPIGNMPYRRTDAAVQAHIVE